MANSDDMRFVITTADGTGTYEGTGCVSSTTWTGGNTNPYTSGDPWVGPPTTTHQWDMKLNEPTMPPELLVCQICGEEDVVVFCEACKEVLKLARKVWAQQILKEIEDDLS